jgi:hypothetical protein
LLTRVFAHNYSKRVIADTGGQKLETGRFNFEYAIAETDPTVTPL